MANNTNKSQKKICAYFYKIVFYLNVCFFHTKNIVFFQLHILSFYNVSIMRILGCENVLNMYNCCSNVKHKKNRTTYCNIEMSTFLFYLIW